MRALCGLALFAASCVPSTPASCAPVEGGREGTTVQLRYVAAGERYLAFTFGFRAESAGMDVPAYRIERTGPGQFAIELSGTFTRNPDGSPSYDERPISARGISDVRSTSDRDGWLRWTVRTDGSACPGSLERVYVGGTTIARAQLFVTFGMAAGVTLEPPAAVAGDPVSVGGLGFSADSSVTLEFDGRSVHTTKADAKGVVNTVLFVPTVAPGTHEVRVRDASGRTATIPFEVVRSP